MLAQNIIFGLLALTMCVASIKLVTTKNVVHAALYLVIVFAGVAAQYVLLAAEFVAVVQVLVYIGAIMVLILFGIMLTRAPIGASQDLDNNQRGVAAVVSLFLFGALGALLMNGFGRVKLNFANEVANGATGALRASRSCVADAVSGALGKAGFQCDNTQGVSDLLFSKYLVPFEVVSVLLLAALVGAVVVARRD